MVQLSYDYDIHSVEDILTHVKVDLFLPEEFNEVVVHETDKENEFIFMIDDRNFHVTIIPLEEEIIVEIDEF